LTSSNYAITFVDGTLDITSTLLTIVANNQVKCYRETFNFQGTEFTSGGLKNNESIGSITITSTGSLSGAAPGNHSIVPSSAGINGTFNPANYSITYSNGTMTVKALPAVSIIGNSEICENGTTTLSPTTGGLWVSNNPDIATVSNTGVVTGILAGSTTFTFIETDTGCGNSTALVTVSALPTATITADGPTTFCEGGNVTLTSSVGSSYLWSTGATTQSINVTSSGEYTVQVTNVSGCHATSSATTVTVNALPTIYNITGGGSYCSGGSGVSVGLDNSQTGVNYQLYIGASAVGSVVSGTTGSPISFGNQTSGGTYTVKATNSTTSCFQDMTGGAVVTINPLPTSYTVTGGGSYCSGGSGVSVGLDNSETGVNYHLYKDGTSTGSSVPGTGSAISFGSQISAGTYTVKATNATTSCAQDMTGSAAITVDTEKPVISCPANISASCSKDLPVVTTIAAFKALGGSVLDNCTEEANLSISSSDVFDLNSGCKVNRTYTITDASGNKATCLQVFTITDVALPVITCMADLLSSPNTGGCTATLAITAPTAISDFCSLVNISPEYSYQLGNTGPLVAGTGSFTATFPEGNTDITWTIKDLCGNTSTPCTQTVRVEFNLTDIEYDNGSAETGLGSGVQPMQTSTHNYFVDDKIAEIGYTYSWGLFADNGGVPGTPVDPSVYLLTENQAEAQITFKKNTNSTPIGNYIISVIKTKDGITCKKQTTLPITVQSNSSFDVVLDNLGNQCQAPGGGLTTISWNVTFPNVISEPFMFSYSIKLGGAVVATGNVTNITYAGTIPISGLSAGAQTSKSANSRAVVIYYSLYGVSGDDLARTVEIEINATDAYQVSEPNKLNNTDDLKINQVPVITFE